jgi:hemoglobin
MNNFETTAEAVRRACIEAALAAYEDAGIRGLCAEGRWEVAIEAVNRLDLSPFTNEAAPGVVPGPAQQSGDVAEKRDVQDEDLHSILTRFYRTLEDDELLSAYFADLDMDVHMPKIVAFWSTILFRTRRYSDNAFAPHMRLEGLTSAHFARWVGTLEATVDERFAGPVAQLMKESAHRIAYSMQLRLGIIPFAPYQISRR